MNKKRFIYLTMGIILVGIAAFASIFIIKNSNGTVTTSEPIEIQAVRIPADVSLNVKELNQVFVKNVAIINGKSNNLLYTFENPENALKTVKERDKDFINLMKKKWNLDEIDCSNWKSYKEKLTQYTCGKLPEDLGGDKYEVQRQQFEGFLEIYQNEELNNETVKYINHVNSLLNTKFFKQVTLDPMVGNFPFDAPVLKS